MKMKKIWRVLAVFLVVAGALYSASQVVHAATLTDVTAGLDSSGNGRVPNEGGDNKTQSFLGAYPSVTVKADGLKQLGSDYRISTSTTEISVTVKGTMTTKPDSGKTDGGKFTSYYFDLLDRNGQSVTTPSKLISLGLQNTSFTFNDTVTFNVDLKDLKDRGPIYIAYCFTTSLSAHVNKYYSTKIGKKLWPSITTSPITNATTAVSGKGDQPGDTITNNVTGDTTTVGSDGKWTLKMSPNDLKSGDKFQIIESNEFGDYGQVFTYASSAPVTIAADKTTLNLSSDDVTKLEAMSDSDFADWVKSEADVTGKSSSGSSVDVKTDTTDLAATLKKVAANDSMPIDFYATDGTKKSAIKTITLVKPGTVKFGTISSDIDFGSHGVPTATALYGPSSAWNVNVSDTRTAGSKWYLYASATDLTSGSHKLPGYLTYRDANGQTSDLTKSTLIDSGDRGTSDTTDVTSNWTTDPKDTSKAGIFLDVEPGVFADSSIKYSGAVNWTLSDVPTP